MLGAPKSLPSDPGELRVAAEGLVELAKAQALQIEKLKHQLAGHNRYRFGSKSETADQLNLQLQLEEEETAAARVSDLFRRGDPPAAWYRFSTDREGKHPTGHLAPYKGWIHADGYTGFNNLFAKDGVHEMACMAHVRRKFVEIFQSQGLETAEEAIRRIALLYAVEKAARGKPPEERVALRQRDAKPVFDELKIWLAAQLLRISGKSELAKAIRYALGRMKKMRGYL